MFIKSYPIPPPPELPDPKLRGQGTIAQWYKGQSIFITGASGFMGKILVEKLLYQCTGLKSIYVLLRPKRGKAPKERLKDMWKLPMFHRICSLDPEAFKKVIPVNGDVLTDSLGLSKADQQELIDNVTVVFHAAATLKLEATLRDAVDMNTAGTERVLELVKQMKNLKVFIHLSTTFCSADLPEFKEKVYPMEHNPREVIQVTKWNIGDVLDVTTPSIIKPHPNTYTYSKRLAECLVASEYPDLPAVIVRPSIVTPTGIEPLAGWVDSLNGPMGIMVAGGKGVIRSMVVKGELKAQVVPADLAISALIAIGWKMGSATVRPADIPVYNLTNGDLVPVTWGEMLDMGKETSHRFPFEQMIWYPDGNMHSSKMVHNFYRIFAHWLPAYLIDFIMIIIREKRFMVRLMKRIDDGLELLQSFTTRKWDFENENLISLSKELDPIDKKAFVLDFEALPIDEYFTICLLGARQYLMKEDLSTIPRCRRVQALMYIIDRAFATAFYLGLIWLVYCYSDTVRDVVDTTAFYLHEVPVIGSLIPTSSKT